MFINRKVVGVSVSSLFSRKPDLKIERSDKFTVDMMLF